MKEKNMGEFKFNSQICTRREQSERLLALGLKPETADCYLFEYEAGKYKVIAESWLDLIADEKYYSQYKNVCFPAWGLDRLFEIMPKRIVFGRETFERTLKPTSISYSPLNWPKEFARCCSTNENYFDCVIDCIAKLIKEGYYNKEYLEE